MKTAVYFPVSTTHYSSTLSLNIRRTKGWQGYGQYLAIQQMLANSKNRKLNFSEVPDIAFNLHISEEDVLNIIKSYFTIEGQEFHSAELEEALLYFDAKYNASRLAGKKSAESKTPEERKALAEKAAKTRWNKDTIDPKLSEINVPKVVLKDDANTLASVSIDAENPQHNPNNKIEQKKNEEKETEKNQIKEEQKEQVSPVVSDLVLSSQTPSFFFSPSEISNQIDDYLKSESKFFFADNRIIVANGYLDFYNEYPNTSVKIDGYEQVLYVHLQSSLSTMTKFIENPNDLNDVLNNIQNLSIPAVSVLDTMNIIKKNSNNAETFKKIISDVQGKELKTFNMEFNNKSIKVLANNDDKTVAAFKNKIKEMEWLLYKYNLLDWKFEFVTHFPMKIIGSCVHQKKKIYINTFNLYLLNWETIQYVLLHEIAHALTPNDPGHGKGWQDKCREIGISPNNELDCSFRKIDEEHYLYEANKFGLTESNINPQKVH